MSNPSLQEQLQALVPTSLPTEKEDGQKKQANKQQISAKHKGAKPAWLEYVYYGIELLKAHYPLCFKEPGDVKPLKIGIKQDLVKHLSTREDIVITDKTCMIKSLSYYVSTLHYFKSVLQDTPRIDLEGKPAGLVTIEEARYSAEQYQAKMQKKATRTRVKT